MNNTDILKEVKMFRINGLLYLGANDEADTTDLCIIPKVDKRDWDRKTYLIDKLTSDYMVLYPEEFSHIRKLIVSPDEIGWVYGMGTTNEMNALYQIPDTDINKIFDNDGKCFIEYYHALAKPRMVGGKVVIHLISNVVVDTDIEQIKDRSCPCLYLNEPCQPNCTCVHPFMSHGCLNCATYGSIEQRKQMAEKLNNYRLFYKANKPETELEKLHNVFERIKLMVTLEDIKEEKQIVVRRQDYEGAAAIREKEREVMDKLEELKPSDKDTIDKLYQDLIKLK